MPEESGSGTAQYVVLMDGYEDWVPFAAMSDPGEAIEARKALAEDADSVCETAPYYPSKQSVIDEEPEEPPKGLEELCVAFCGSEVIAISDSDMAAREATFQKLGGGPRKTVSVYNTFDELATDKPSAIGKFIASEMTAGEILEAVR